jgi:hypothetical protein
LPVALALILAATASKRKPFRGMSREYMLLALFWAQ